MGKINKKILVLVIFLIVILSILVMFLKPDEAETTTSAIQTPSEENSNTHLSAGVQENANKQLPILPDYLAGTDIDCPIQVDKNDQLILTVGIRNCFDYFLSMNGKVSDNQIIADIKQYLNATLPSPAALYATQLLQKYLDYKKSAHEAQIKQKVKVQDAKTYKEVIALAQSLQSSFFTQPEIQAFFGDENAFNIFNYDKIRISENKSLTPVEKAEKISELIDTLPPQLADGVKTMEQFNQLQTLTKEIQDKGGDSAELRAMREKLVGSAAADRLEAVDQDDANWKSRVDNYLSQRDQIKNSSGSEVAKQQKIDVIRQNAFPNKEDQIRSQTFEQMHDAQIKK